MHDPSRLAAEHTEYLTAQLADSGPSEPFALCDAWLDEAFTRRAEHADMPEPSAVVLSTVEIEADGTPQPRSRTVLLKGRDQAGFVFYTNYDSAKGDELLRTPRAALLLPWYSLQRQLRIEGGVEQLTAAESDAYFASRPRGSRIGAWASDQSRPAGSRAQLEQQYAQFREQFGDGEVPRPPHWGGFRVVPQRIEFWQGRENRMHDRIEYRRPRPTGEGDAEGLVWQRRRLQP